MIKNFKKLKFLYELFILLIFYNCWDVVFVRVI